MLFELTLERQERLRISLTEKSVVALSIMLLSVAELRIPLLDVNAGMNLLGNICSKKWLFGTDRFAPRSYLDPHVSVREISKTRG